MGLAVRSRLVQSDLGTPIWQRDLSVSFERVGEVQMWQGTLAASIEAGASRHPFQLATRKTRSRLPL